MRKNWFLNIGLALVGLAILVWFMFIWMNWYTRHSDFVEVPAIKGIVYEEAVKKLEDAGLRFEVYDSVYNEDFKKNAVTEQDPPAKTQVKPDRIIYISVNALARPKVKMPKLVDQSITLSKAVLKNAGLTLGNVTYKWDDIGHNLVIEQLYKGSPVLPGKMLERGAVIDLVVSTNRRGVAEPDSTLSDEFLPGEDPGEGPGLDLPPADKKHNAASNRKGGKH